MSSAPLQSDLQKAHSLATHGSGCELCNSEQVSSCLLKSFVWATRDWTGFLDKLCLVLQPELLRQSRPTLRLGPGVVWPGPAQILGNPKAWSHRFKPVQQAWPFPGRLKATFKSCVFSSPTTQIPPKSKICQGVLHGQKMLS